MGVDPAATETPISERSSKLAVNPPVFFTSAAALVAFLVFGTFYSDVAAEIFPAMLDAVATYFGWFYVLSVAFFFVFCVGLVFSKYRHVRLGRDEDRPEYSTLSWFAMLFSAGMGIGLVFYGVAQPMLMYAQPPVGAGASAEAARNALPLTFFHWGLHAWAIYVAMGLAIAYFAYRRGLPLTLRSPFYPLVGDRIHGVFGHAVDILAVFGTLFGLATSLGLGAKQINAGLAHLFGMPTGTTPQIILIAVITACATISLITGVDKGIRRLSEFNMILAVLLMIFVFAVGPTLYILDGFPDHVGVYFSTFVEQTFSTGRLDGASDWNKSWTYFYWAWWLAWAPFVGMFVARISKGRTIGEFITGVLLVPTLVTFIWFTVFGDTALWLETEGGGGIVDAVNADVSTAVFVVLERLPFGNITALLAAAVVTVFFVTSSDSASFVVDMLTSGGHPNPPIWQRVFWAVSEGAVAAVLLGAAGKAGLEALQAAVVCIGAPFAILLVLMCFSLLKALRQYEG